MVAFTPLLNSTFIQWLHYWFSCTVVCPLSFITDQTNPRPVKAKLIKNKLRLLLIYGRRSKTACNQQLQQATAATSADLSQWRMSLRRGSEVVVVEKVGSISRRLRVILTYIKSLLACGTTTHTVPRVTTVMISTHRVRNATSYTCLGVLRRPQVL